MPSSCWTGPQSKDADTHRHSFLVDRPYASIRVGQKENVKRGVLSVVMFYLRQNRTEVEQIWNRGNTLNYSMK